MREKENETFSEITWKTNCSNTGERYESDTWKKGIKFNL